MKNDKHQKPRLDLFRDMYSDTDIVIDAGNERVVLKLHRCHWEMEKDIKDHEDALIRILRLGFCVGVCGRPPK